MSKDIGFKLNTNARSYVPTQTKTEIYQKEEDNIEYEEDNEEDELLNELVKEEIKKAGLDSDTESDCEKWFPEFKDCECCEGFIYICQSKFCKDFGVCFCKTKSRLDKKFDKEEKKVENDTR